MKRIDREMEEWAAFMAQIRHLPCQGDDEGCACDQEGYDADQESDRGSLRFQELSSITASSSK